jgi:hypothetical protein
MQPGMNMKVFYRAHHNYRDTLEKYVKNIKGANAFAKYVSLDEAHVWQRAMESKQLIRTEVYVAFTLKPSVSFFNSATVLQNLNGFWNLLFGSSDGAFNVQRTAEQHRDALRSLEAAVLPCVQTMVAAGLDPVRLTSEGLQALAYEVLNPNRALWQPAPKVTRPDFRNAKAFGRFASKKGQAFLRTAAGGAYRFLVPDSVRKQLCFSDWRVTENYVETDGVYQAIVALRWAPDTVQEGLILQLLQLPFALNVSVDVFSLSKEKESQALLRAATIAESTSKVTFLKNSTGDPREAAKANEAMQRYLDSAGSDQNFFRFRLLVTVIADSPAALDERCQSVMSTMRMMNAMEGVREQFGVDELLRASWPFSLISALNTKKLLTKEVSTLLPLHGTTAGVANPIALFRDQTGHLVGHDAFDLKLANWNRIICGRSGAGKSVTATLADTISLLASGAELMVVDSGGSFWGVCAALGDKGFYMRAGLNSKYQYNIFDLPKNFASLPEKGELSQDVVVSTKVSSIKDIVLVMAGIKDERAAKRASGVLSELILGLYNDMLQRSRSGRISLGPETTPRLRDLHLALKQYQNPGDGDLQQLITGIYNDLKPYVHADGGTGVEGNYSRIFDVHTNFDPDAQMIVFELADVKDNADIMNPLALVYIAGLMFNRMIRRDGVKRMVILDEAWALLEHPVARGIIIRLFREGRKYSTAVSILTQSYSDVSASEAGKVLIENSASMYFLRHGRLVENTRAFTDKGLNDRKIEQIYALQQVRGEYSEIMLNAGDSWCVVRLEPTPLKYWVATTHGPDIVMRTKYLERYGKRYQCTVAQVLFILAQDYPKGVDADRGGPKLSEHAALSLAEQFLQNLAELDGGT